MMPKASSLLNAQLLQVSYAVFFLLVPRQVFPLTIAIAITCIFLNGVSAKFRQTSLGNAFGKHLIKTVKLVLAIYIGMNIFKIATTWIAEELGNITLPLQETITTLVVGYVLTDGHRLQLTTFQNVFSRYASVKKSVTKPDTERYPFSLNSL
jgi:hypothetical protein